ncbi:cytoplasmic protein NCK2-like [Oppia nitens]|uniref:cytoplasmic protein NCK2-like n=1 Tax=Oppia nitens TaxID=1686743 RepID=UPI0023DAAADC|nr:cytoplasmic protein NCK2-like [Oppia nitens]
MSHQKSGKSSEEVIVIAKYDYTAQGSQELDLRKNERLVLLDDSKHWWKVVNTRNQSGFVPSNYVKKEKPSIFDSIRKKVRKKTDSHSNRHNSPLSSPMATKAVDINITSSPNCSLPRPDTSANKRNVVCEGSTSSTDYHKSVAYAKYNYESQQSDELSLVKGAKVIVMEKSSDGWWKGELNGSIGWFPSNYVCEETSDLTNNCLDQNNMITKNAKLVNDISSESNRNCVSMMTNNGNNSSINKNCVLDYVIALYSFESQNEEELSFQKSERLEIIERPVNDPDWWKARNQHGEVGLVPKNYVQVVTDTVNDNFNSFSLTSIQKELPKVNTAMNSPLMNTRTQMPLDCKSDINDRIWYYGAISRGQCDRMLNELALDGDFLIRDSETNAGDYSVSLKSPLRNKHFRVHYDDGVYCIGQRRFASLDELIEHYKKAPIYTSPKGDKMFLIKPFSRP